MNKIELKDFLDFHYLSQPQLSPDGQAVGYVVSQADWQENGYSSYIWLYADGKNRKLTGLGEESSFVWEDEEHILFKANRTKAEKKREQEQEIFSNYYRINIYGGEAEAAYQFACKVKKLKPIGSNRLVLIGEIDVDYPDYYKMTADQQKQVREKYKENEDYQVIDEIPFWHNGGSYANKRRDSLFLYDTKTECLERISSANTQVFDFEVVDEQLYYMAVEYEQVMPLRADLYCYQLAQGTIEAVLTEADFDVESITRLGSDLIVSGSDKRQYGLNQNGDFYRVVSNQLEWIQKHDYSLGSSVGSDCRYGGGTFRQADDKGLYFITTVRNASVIYKLTVDGLLEPVVTVEGSVDCLTVSPEGRLVFVAMFGQQLQELYEYVDGQIKALTQFNATALTDKYIAQPEKVTFQSQSTEIDGWVLKPIDFDPNRSYPAILEVHGGPKTVYGEVYYHELQYLAAEGYFVLFCNPTGSDGRGNQFMDIRGKYGTVDYQNLMDFTDYVLETYPQIDRNRLGQTGGSYGGFMTNWIVGHTDRFKACVSQRSISNWLSFYGMSDIGFYFATDQMGVNGFNQAEQERMWEQSPLKYVTNVKTPLLLIHSDMDYRCNLEEGMQFFTAVARQGVDTRLVVFKGENHELSRSGKPKHRVRRLEEIIGWMNQYLK